MSKGMATVTRAGILGVAAAITFTGALAQMALITAIGIGLSVGGFIIAFKPTLRSFIQVFSR